MCVEFKRGKWKETNTEKYGKTRQKNRKILRERKKSQERINRKNIDV